MTTPEISALHARIDELASRIAGSRFSDVEATTKTNCESKGCTNCRGDKLENVLLPGEAHALSGAELVQRLQANR